MGNSETHRLARTPTFFFRYARSLLVPWSSERRHTSPSSLQEGLAQRMQPAVAVNFVHVGRAPPNVAVPSAAHLRHRQLFIRPAAGYTM